MLVSARMTWALTYLLCIYDLFWLLNIYSIHIFISNVKVAAGKMFSHFLRLVTRRVQEFLGVKTAKAAKLLDILLTVYYSAIYMRH